MGWPTWHGGCASSTFDRSPCRHSAAGSEASTGPTCDRWSSLLSMAYPACACCCSSRAERAADRFQARRSTSRFRAVEPVAVSVSLAPDRRRALLANLAHHHAHVRDTLGGIERLRLEVRERVLAAER